ncbi:MAG TPA: hypothetical protein VF316_09205, partial [Polyangiaceae bacterium]
KCEGEGRGRLVFPVMNPIPSSRRRGALALLVSIPCLLAACVDVSGQFHERQASDARQVAQGCNQQLGKLQATYCAKPMTNPPVGMADVVTQQRNGLATQCKDSESATKLQSLDGCIKEMHAHE